MRSGICGGQVRAVRSVDWREDWVRAFRVVPALHDARHGERHAVAGLMARHARAAVRAERFEERMTFGLDGTARIHDPKSTRGVRVLDVSWQRPPVAWRPP